MRLRNVLVALCLLGYALSAAPATAGNSTPPGATTPPQVAYNLTISTHGTSVATASHDAIFGTVTLACLSHGVPAIVGRDVQNRVIYQRVLHAPPTADIPLQAYSRAFSEIQRVAWGLCAPEQPFVGGAQRTVSQKGQFAVGGFAFPDEIRIQDQLGVVGCEAEPRERMGRATSCESRALLQPFVTTLSRKPR